MNKKKRVTEPGQPTLRPRIIAGLALDKLVHSGLINHADDVENQYKFKHALVLDSAHAFLLKQDREHLHRAAAEALERLYPEALDENAARLAQHFAIAQDDGKTLEYEIRAGDVALRLHASSEARSHYASALAVWERLPGGDAPSSRHIDLILKLVTASMYTDDPALNMKRLERAESICRQLSEPNGKLGGDRLRLARVALARGLIYFLQNETRRAIESFQQVLPVAQEFQDEDLLTRPATAIGSVMTMQGHFDKAAPLLARALPLLERSGDWSNWVIATGFMGLGLAARGQYAEGLAKGQAALAAAYAAHDPTAIAQGHNIFAMIYMEGGDLPRMLEEGVACEQAAIESGDRMYQYIGIAIQAWAENRMGNYSASFEKVSQAQALVGHLGTQILGSDWRAAAMAELALGAGTPDQAIVLAQDAVVLAQAVGGIFAEGMARRVWGKALALVEPSEPENAHAQLALSLQLFESGEAVIEAARTQVEWGRVLRRQGANSAALEHFELARRQYESAGLIQMLEETRLLLRDAAAT